MQAQRETHLAHTAARVKPEVQWSMSNAQFFTALCLPLVVFIIGLYHQNTGIRDLRSELIQFRSEVNARFVAIDARFNRVDQRFDDLTSKVVDIDNRMVRVEERLKL